MDDSERQVDPEIAADLKLREATERDTTRTRAPVTVMGGTWPPVYVVSWPCRVKSCRVPVPVTDAAVDALATMNRKLVRDGSYPIDTADVVFCPEHESQLARARIDWAIQARDKTREAILELRSDPPPHPERERDLLEKLDALGHPDVKGLGIWLAEERKRGKSRRGA